MMKELKNILWIILPAILMLGCQQEKFELNETPLEEADATFTVTEVEGEPNTYLFTNDSEGFLKAWDFNNGSKAEGKSVKAYFPFAGSYDVTLTVFNKGGSVKTSQVLDVLETDPTICEVEELQFLTGGCGTPEGKTWVFDRDREAYFGVQYQENDPWDYVAKPGEQDATSFIDDEYTFKLVNFEFEMETNGNVQLRSGLGLEGDFPGATENSGHLSAPYENPEDLTYFLFEDETGAKYISISTPGFIGFFGDTRTYEIVELEQNYLLIRYIDQLDANLRWYQGFIPKGFAPLEASFSVATNGLTATLTNTSLNAETYSWSFENGTPAASTEENPVVTFPADGTYTITLTATGSGQEDVFTTDVTVTSVPKVFPITFEDGDIQFGGFGGTVFDVIDNPDASGVNTSTRVGEYVKGFDGSWAGIELTLDEPIDFSSNTTLAMKVRSPVTGRALFKIEESSNSASFVEVFADITETDQWQTLTFDFSGAATDTYDKIALFMDFDNNNGGTFYIDDVGFDTEETNELTLDLLTGDGEKTWVLKQEAGAFGVGEGPGGVNYFALDPNSGDPAFARPCVFNDEYTFRTGGQYEYDATDDVWGAEYFVGLNAECTAETSLNGTDAEAWASGLHSFSFTPATASESAKITVRGTGAFIGIPKAYNGGEYSSAPPPTNVAVTYDVVSYVKNASEETLVLTINVGGNVYWSFTFVPKS